MRLDALIPEATDGPHAALQIGGLAADSRKAKQGSRHQAKETFFEHSKDIFGVAVVCPVLLLQLAMLRGAASMHPMTDSDLALLLFLEAACQGAIREGFGQELGGSIWETTRSLRGGPHETSLSAIDGAVGYYLAKKTAVARQAALLPVMLALSPVIRMSMPSGPGRLSPAEMESFAGDVDTITASAKL